MSSAGRYSASIHLDPGKAQNFTLPLNNGELGNKSFSEMEHISREMLGMS